MKQATVTLIVPDGVDEATLALAISSGYERLRNEAKSRIEDAAKIQLKATFAAVDEAFVVTPQTYTIVLEDYVAPVVEEETPVEETVAATPVKKRASR